MAHIHTDPGHHDLTASAFIVRVDGPEPRVLLHMHKKLKCWMHMGGHVELHETPWATIIHEIREESGYELGQLRLLQPPHAITYLGDRSIAHPLPFVFATHPYGEENHYHTDTSYLFVTKENSKHPVGKNESEVLRLFTREEIEQLPPERLSENMRIQMQYIFDHLLQEWGEVDPASYSTRVRSS